MVRYTVVLVLVGFGLVVVGVVLLSRIVPLGFLAYQPLDADDVDVSNRKKLWGEYEPEATYVLDIPVYMIRAKRRSIDAALVPPRGQGEGNHLGILLYRSPGPVEYLEKLEDRWPKGVGIVERGTRIRCVRILAERSFATFNAYPVGQILDGRHAGELVDMTDVSEFCARKTEVDVCLGPDMDIFTVVPSSADSEDSNGPKAGGL
jgi:hypothetical protein